MPELEDSLSYFFLLAVQFYVHIDLIHKQTQQLHILPESVQQ